MMHQKSKACLFAQWLAMAVLIAGCAMLPRDYPQMVTTAFEDTRGTRLGRELAPMVAAHTDASGIYVLHLGTDAFVARTVLADLAERSLDVQYYIWHADTTGKLLTDRLLQAADRGVRVRVLLDDIQTGGMDRHLVALDAHANIEIRVFNPFVYRSLRGFGFLADFARLNRRMHNKSFTADNQAAIVGGRNIGDEYFDASSMLGFQDLDALAVGPVVKEISASFDAYWNSEFAIPIAVLAPEPPSDRLLEDIRAALRAHTETTRESTYGQALRETPLAMQLMSRKLPFFWGKAWLAYDPPQKVKDNPGNRATHLITKVLPVVKDARSELILANAYFVPTDVGTEILRELRERGVHVKVLTNSLASTDVLPVHAGYARHRMNLLRAGVELYEIQPTARQLREGWTKGLMGSSPRVGLHGKVFVVDRRVMFIGSYNIDPRSAVLNTEMGIVFDDPELAGIFVNKFEAWLPEHTYKLELQTVASGGGEALYWVTQEDGREVRLDSEPHASIWRRLGVWLFSVLPIERQL
jgi:cardiolipin synthase C